MIGGGRHAPVEARAFECLAPFRAGLIWLFPPQITFW